MEPTPRLLNFAEEVAAKVAARNKLDPDTVLSTAFWLALEAASKTKTELDSLRLLNTYLARRLISSVLDELKVFGPVTNAIRQRRFVKGDEGQTFQRWPADMLKNATVRSEVGEFDFLEQFDARQQQFILLLIAGYTYTELYELGFTRCEITKMRGVLEDVYAIR